MTCEDCRYFVELGPPRQQLGECRLNPPTHRGFPLASKETWCGQHKEREIGEKMDTEGDQEAGGLHEESESGREGRGTIRNFGLKRGKSRKHKD